VRLTNVAIIGAGLTTVARVPAEEGRVHSCWFSQRGLYDRAVRRGRSGLVVVGGTCVLCSFSIF